MSIQSHLESAEESIRQALVEALAAKKDGSLSGLFDLLKSAKKIKTENPDYDFSKDFVLSSDYLNDHNVTIGDSNINIDTSAGADIISFPTPEGSVDLSGLDLNLDVSDPV